MVKKAETKKTIGAKSKSAALSSESRKKKDSKKPKGSIEKKSAMIQLDHDFSFNLLTEPWLPVVTLKGEKKFLSLNDFIKTCQNLERFDFPLPGLETAVIRFMVAMVHIVGAPKDKKEWEEWLRRGKFEDGFFQEMQKYKNKLDLFSQTEPFMQNAKLKDCKEDEFDDINRLINYYPSKTNPSHWFHKYDGENSNVLSPSSLVWLLLLYNSITFSGGSGYKPGINGKPPNYVILNGDNLFITIVLNTPNNSFLANFVNIKQIKKPENGFILKSGLNCMPNEVNLQTGLLWNSRQLLFIPIANRGKKKCSISMETSNIVVNQFIMKPQEMSLKKGTYWSDPHVIKIDLGKKGLKNLNESGELPNWREYPSLLMTSGRKNEKTKALIFPTITLQQLSHTVNKSRSIRLSYFSFSTINNAKINQIEENKYYFQSNFIDNQEMIAIIERMVDLIYQFSYQIKVNLKTAFNIKTGSTSEPPNFQTAYWHELGSAFEESLAQLANTDKEPDEVLREWKIMLAEHVRETFKRHTEKLISNPKHLKHYEAARLYLEHKIYAKDGLLPRPKKTENRRIS